MSKGSAPRSGRFDRPSKSNKIVPDMSDMIGRTMLSGVVVVDNRTPQEKYEDNWELIFRKK